MALATRCPECSTIFRISTVQAAAKGGTVRCGHCSNVFNSLDALVRVEDLDIVEEVMLDGTAVSTNGPAAAPASEVETGAATGTTEAAIASVDEPDSDAAPPSGPAGVDATVESDESDGLAKPSGAEWWLPDPAAGPEAHPPLPAVEPEATAETVFVAAGRTEAERTGVGTGIDGQAPEFMRSGVATPPRHRAAGWALGLLALLAAFALLAQAAYLWRNEAAARWPAAKPWLVAACVRLRCTVDYPAHVESITIESSSIQTTGPDSNVYVLTGLLRNRDPVDVRYPYLSLVLTDVQDQPILRRALRPEDYLPSGRDASRAGQSGFAAESELPIRVMFELNGLRFTGYHLDKYYP